ncbi:MAG: hypothetical protein WAR57_12270 [Candidatus Phosphoribacter sp.]|nr:hypothetical protein [Actinomycetales bacterium]
MSADDGSTTEDRELLAWLARTCADVDPEPDDLRELGRAALSVRRVDAELAALVGDCALTGSDVRSSETTGDGHRLLAFGLGDLLIETQVSARPGGVSLLGVVEGITHSAEGRVELESTRAPTRRCPLDRFARFWFTAVPAGLVRLRVVAVGHDVTTQWVTVGR